MKRSRSVSRQYSAPAKWLHWVVALLVLAALSTAFQFAFVAPEDRAGAVPTHASIGLTIVALTLVRLAWRGVSPPPPPPSGTSPGLQRSARAGHLLLYAVILYQGLLGIWMAALSPVAIRLYGGFNLSALAPANPEALVVLRQFHAAGAVVLALTVILHVAAALWHHFVRRDDVLIRMLPFGGLWQRLSAPTRALEVRFPSLLFHNWPKRRPRRATRK